MAQNVKVTGRFWDILGVPNVDPYPHGAFIGEPQVIMAAEMCWVLLSTDLGDFGLPA